MRAKTPIRRKSGKLEYWLFHPTKRLWIGPYKAVSAAKREATTIAAQIGKGVEVFARNAGSSVAKSLEMMRGRK